MSCPVNSSGLYLAFIGSPFGEHITAEFCQASYWIQDVILTVAEHDMAVVSSTLLASPVKLSYDDFNPTSFQSILWIGKPDISTKFPPKVDLRDEIRHLDMNWRLHTLNINLQGSFTAGFA